MWRIRHFTVLHFVKARSAITHFATRRSVTLCLRSCISLIITLALVSCGTEEKKLPLSGPLSGRISLWHSWSGVQADAFANVLSTFHEIHPDIHVQVTYIPASEMLERYMAAADSGLGPDLFLGAGEWTPALAESHLIVDLSRLIQSDNRYAGEGEADNDPIRRILTRYPPAALDAVRSADGLYGLPQALNVQALLYNKSLVPEPPATLDQLLALASQETTVGIGIAFEDAFWGVPAFGGQLRDDAGRYILDRGGFANWLNWLKGAREAPGIILDADRAELRKRFREQELGIYVGSSDELPEIMRPAQDETEEEKLIREEQLGVSQLPTGPTGNPGPFLRVNSFFFNTASSAEQFALAIALADFVTNAEQSLDLMRDGRIVPANIGVRVNPRLDPKMAAFVSQARSAVPLPITEYYADFQRYGNTSYREVLEGLAQPAEAAIDLTHKLNQAAGLSDVQTEAVECLDTGLITVLDGATSAANALSTVADGGGGATPPSADSLGQTIQRFRQACPSIIVQRTLVSPEEWRQRTTAAALNGASADLLLGPHSAIPLLVDAERIQEITGRVTSEEIQQFLPNALEAMRYRGRLFGVPYAVDIQTLYYNQLVVREPLNTLDEWERFADANAATAIQTTFDAGYWGLSAFGSQRQMGATTNGGSNGAAEAADFVLDIGAFVDWLTWLRSRQSTPGILLNSDGQTLLESFHSGSSAYYVGPSRAWPLLTEEMGAERVGVLTLPAGPLGESHALLHATGFLFNSAASDAQLALALKFVHFATSQENQQLLMEQLGHTPVTVGINTEAVEPIAIFASSINESTVAPAGRLAAALESGGNQAYTDVLSQGLQPTEALSKMVEQLWQISDTDVVTTNLESQPTMWFGDLRLDLLHIERLNGTTENPE